MWSNNFRSNLQSESANKWVENPPLRKKTHTILGYALGWFCLKFLTWDHEIWYVYSMQLSGIFDEILPKQTSFLSIIWTCRNFCIFFGHFKMLKSVFFRVLWDQKKCYSFFLCNFWKIFKIVLIFSFLFKIYNEDICDLLDTSKTKLKIRHASKKGSEVVGLTQGKNHYN